MQIPYAVATFNRHVNNRIQGLWAWLLPPWAILVHTGRTSGRTHSTPVVGFVGPDGFVVPMLYGPRTQWVKNLLAAGGGQLRRGGRVYRLEQPRVVPSAQLSMRGLGRRYCTAADEAFVARITRQRAPVS